MCRRDRSAETLLLFWSGDWKERLEWTGGNGTFRFFFSCQKHERAFVLQGTKRSESWMYEDLTNKEQAQGKMQPASSGLRKQEKTAHNVSPKAAPERVLHLFK